MFKYIYNNSLVTVTLVTVLLGPCGGALRLVTVPYIIPCFQILTDRTTFTQLKEHFNKKFTFKYLVYNSIAKTAIVIMVTEVGFEP